MNTIDMQVVTVRETGRDRKFAYEISISLDSPGEGLWILIPEDVSMVAVAVYTTISCTVEATIDTLDRVKTGTAIPVEWTKGAVTENYQDYCIPVTAIRLKQLVAGSCRMIMRAQ